MHADEKFCNNLAREKTNLTTMILQLIYQVQMKTKPGYVLAVLHDCLDSVFCYNSDEII